MNSPELKRKRGSNFTQTEKKALLKLVSKHSVLQDKGLTSDVVTKKRDTWEQLTKEFNVHCATSGPRTWYQLRHLYENLKHRLKNKIENRIEDYDDADFQTTDYASASDQTEQSDRSRYSDLSLQSDNDESSQTGHKEKYTKKHFIKRKVHYDIDHTEECEAFANYVAVSLRKMPKKHFVNAKALIQQTLTCIELNIMDEENYECQEFDVNLIASNELSN